MLQKGFVFLKLKPIIKMKKQELITITTREHYNKYKNLTKGINREVLKNLVRDLYKDEDELKQKFKEDIILNNISMREIDNKFNWVATLICRKNKLSGLSLGESCCIIKYILKYIVLKVKPYFQEDIKNYKELYKEWYNLPHKKQYPTTKKYYGLDMWYLDNKDKWILENE